MRSSKAHKAPKARGQALITSSPEVLTAPGLAAKCYTCSSQELVAASLDLMNLKLAARTMRRP